MFFKKMTNQPVRRVFVLISIIYSSLHATAQHNQVRSALSLFSNDSIDTYVKQLSGIKPISLTDTIKTRQANTDGNELAFQFITKRMLSWNLEVDSQTFSSKGKNLIVTKQGYKSNRFILLGAHFDDVGNNQSLNMFPGADDNASGTAATMEAARIISQYEWPFTIKFAFWDEEELGLLGSKAYCPPNDIDNFMGYVNLDMIAWDSNNDSSFEIHSNSVSNSSELAQRAVNAISDYKIPLKYKLVNPGDPATDHQSFWGDGMTAIGLNEEYSGSDFNPNWHQITDSITKFNLPYFHSIAKLALATIADCAIDTNRILLVNKISHEKPQLYPNPAKDILHLKLPITNNKIIKIIDLQGKILYESVLGPSDQIIDIRQIDNGLYYVQINGDNFYTISKLIIIN